MFRFSPKALLALGIAMMMLAGNIGHVQAQVAGGQGQGQGQGRWGGGGGDGGVNMPHNGRICILIGGDRLVCFYVRRPAPKLTGDICCWQRVVKKRMRVFGRMQTVYVDKGRTCRKVTSRNQCARMSLGR